jgi:hydroxypyruvate isomerase
MDSNRRQFLTASATLAAAGIAGTAAAGQPRPAPPEDTTQLGRTAHTKFAPNIEMWWAGSKLSPQRRIEEAARLGYSAVEMWPYEGKDINAIVDVCQKHKVEITQFTAWGFTPGLNDPKNHDRFVQKLEEACKVAERLNCKMMCVVGGNDIPGMTQRQMHDNIIAGLRRGAPIAEKHNVTLILEAMNIRVDHKGHCLYGSEPTMRILKAVGSRHVKMLMDLYHAQITEGDLCGHIRENFDQAVYYQIADHPGRNDPGTGEVHYNRVLKQLHDLGYRGHIGLEFRPRNGEVEAARNVWRADQW